MNGTLSSFSVWFSSLFIFFTCFSAISGYAQFDGGDGTEEDPWQIATIEQLQSISDHLEAHFILTADIDASSTAVWNDGLGFEPIGDLNSRFTGSLDGNGFSFTGLTIKRENQNYVGLFGVIQNGTLQNITLTDAEIIGRNYTGGLVGSLIDGSVLNSAVIGVITGNDNTGGLTGTISESNIQQSYSSAVITAEMNIGGLSGFSEYSKLSNSYSVSDVYGNRNVGGLIGMVMVVSSYPEGMNNMAGFVSGSFTAGLVNGDEYTGGLIGEVQWIALTKSAGNSEATISDSNSVRTSYWDCVATGQQFADGSVYRWEYFEVDTVGLDTERMTGQNAYIHMLDFDFDETWQLTSGYPVLSWQDSEDTVEIPEVPRIVTESGSIEFGISGIGIQKTIGYSINNRGIADLTVDVSISGPDDILFMIDEPDQSFTISPDDTITIPVHFTPKTDDPAQAELFIEHDAQNKESPFVVSLSGKGADLNFAGGSGTAEDPWQIETLDQLDDMRLVLQDHYILNNDIDASETLQWNDGEGFNPIGDSGTEFSGSFNGSSYKISGLYIDRHDLNGVGLFGFLDGATIQGVILNEVQISGGWSTGSLAGYKRGGEVSGSEVHGTVQASNSNAGGLIGNHRYGDISGVSSTVNVTGINQTGGLVGFNTGVITDSWASGDVTGQNKVGGLVGGNGYEPPRAGFITRSYATGDVTGENRVGGLTGDHLNGEIEHVFSTGNVSGVSSVGGLIGYSFEPVSYAYAAAAVEGESYIGGIAGRTGPIGLFGSVFWDMDVSGINEAVGSGSSDGITGASTSEMYQQNTFEGWDFDETWSISEGESYPWLQELGMPVSNEPESHHADLSRSVELHQNYPNPFNPVTVIGYRLPESREVTLEVFDITGRRVAVLIDNEFRTSGTHRINFQAGSFSSGVYFYQLKAGDQTQTQKMTLIK